MNSNLQGGVAADKHLLYSRPMRFVICGAGAVGSTVGGYLAASGVDVCLSGNPAHLGAIQERGLRVRSARGDVTSQPVAVTDLARFEWHPGDVVILTCKSQDTEGVLGSLADCPPGTPLFCFQNGVRNEERAAVRFSNVYGVLVLFSANFIEPGIVEHTRNDELTVGRFPAGIDALQEAAGRVLEAAGFRVTHSASVMAHKWGKLLVNLNNALYALVDTWLQRAYTEIETRAFLAETMREGLHVLDVCGIPASMGPGEPEPAEFIARLERGAYGYTDPEKLPPERRTYPSTWQDVVRRRRDTEVEHFNGEIVRLGESVGVPTPCNRALLECMRSLMAAGAMPGLFSLDDVRKKVEDYRRA